MSNTTTLEQDPSQFSTESLNREPLTAHDRCDAGAKGKSCGAQAWARATLASGGVLLFCGHHFKKYAASLASNGAMIEDFTDNI